MPIREDLVTVTEHQSIEEEAKVSLQVPTKHASGAGVQRAHCSIDKLGIELAAINDPSQGEVVDEGVDCPIIPSWKSGVEAVHNLSTLRSGWLGRPKESSGVSIGLEERLCVFHVEVVSFASGCATIHKEVGRECGFSVGGDVSKANHLELGIRGNGLLNSVPTEL